MEVKATNKLVKFLIEKSRKLSERNLAEVLDFVDFLATKHEETTIKKGIYALADKCESFEFLVKEPNLYSLKDAK
jgi:hypothetical protein